MRQIIDPNTVEDSIPPSAIPFGEKSSMAKKNSVQSPAKAPKTGSKVEKRETSPSENKVDTVEESAEEFYDETESDESSEPLVSSAKPAEQEVPKEILEAFVANKQKERAFVKFVRLGDTVDMYDWKVIPAETIIKKGKDGKEKEVTHAPMVEFMRIMPSGKAIASKCVASQMLVTQLNDRANRGIKVVSVRYTGYVPPSSTNRGYQGFIVLPA